MLFPSHLIDMIKVRVIKELVYHMYQGASEVRPYDQDSELVKM